MQKARTEHVDAGPPGWLLESIVIRESRIGESRIVVSERHHSGFLEDRQPRITIHD